MRRLTVLLSTFVRARVWRAPGRLNGELFFSGWRSGMSRILVAVFGAMLVAAVGCQNEDKHDDMKSSSSSAMKSSSSADVCAHCPGVQTATADGKCSACGAELAKK
jgi:hypothetical protein